MYVNKKYSYFFIIICIYIFVSLMVFLMCIITNNYDKCALMYFSFLTKCASEKI